MLVAAGIAWVVLLGGLSSGRPHTDRFAGRCPGFLRVGEYGGLVWIAANAGDSSHAAAFALIAALVFHHYDLVYRPRFQGVRAADVVELRGRRLGRPARARLGAAGAPARCPPGCSSSPGCSRVGFAVECVLSWARLSVEPLSVYEDEEDEGQ